MSLLPPSSTSRLAPHSDGCGCALCASQNDDTGTGEGTDIAATGTGPKDSLEWGTSLSDTSIDVYFATNGVSFDGVTSEGFNAYEIRQFELAFEMISEVTNVTFNTVSSRAQSDWTVVLDTNELPAGLLGYFYLPGGSGGVFNGDEWDRSAGGNLEVGGTGFATIVHELLHGLGLAHPHDGGGASAAMPGVTSAFNDYGNTTHQLNQGVFTTMSYNGGYNTGPNGTAGQDRFLGGDWGYEAGPMALDIAVVQDLYGANTSTRTGNDTYVLPGSNTGGTAWKSIWDAGGTSDTIAYSGSRDATIDLRQATLQYEEGGGGFLSSVAGVAGGFTIANGAVIENATGGSGNDTLTGNTADNILNGGAGNNLLIGGLGNDELRGLGGSDTANGGQGRDRAFLGGGNDVYNDHVQTGFDGSDLVFLGSGNDTANLDGGNDTVHGMNGEDVIFGGVGNNVIYAGAGNDRALGGNGNDRIWGGTGADTLEGGAGNDVMYGFTGNDTLEGGTGNDTLWGGDGNDTADGGTGSDRGFLGAGDDVFTDNGETGANGSDLIFMGLGNDTANGDGGNDIFHGLGGDDLLIGGIGNDTLYGGTNADTLDSGSGNDLVFGGLGTDLINLGSGDDTFRDSFQGGPLGQDTITGGSGADTFVFTRAGSADTITDFEVGIDTLRLNGNTWPGMLTAEEVIDQFASVVAGGVLLDFGNGNSILLEGLNSTAGLAGDIDLY